MPHRISVGSLFRLLVIPFLYTISGCQINDYDPNPTSEDRENFIYTRGVSGKAEFYLTNVNGTVTVIGVDTLSQARISGTKIVKDQSVDEATRHIADITIDVAESPTSLTVKTLQPSTSDRRTYQVNYEVLIPSSWKVSINDVNGNVDIQNFHSAVTSSVVNGIVNATDISGNVSVSVTNGTINGKVYLPENGSCSLGLVNGNISLLVPRTLSASVSATVMVGTVSVTNLPIAYTTNTLTSVVGTAGGGKGNVRLSSVAGVVQLIGM
jgi:hypothetical protein